MANSATEVESPLAQATTTRFALAVGHSPKACASTLNLTTMLISYNPQTAAHIVHSRSEEGGFDTFFNRPEVFVTYLWRLADEQLQRDLFDMAGKGWLTQFWPDREPRKGPTIAPECPQNDDQPAGQG